MQRKRRKKKRFGVFLFLLVVCIGIGIMFVPWAMQPENFREVKNKINGFLYKEDFPDSYNAKSLILVDCSDDEIFVSKNENEPQIPASLAKLFVIEYASTLADLDSIVVADYGAISLTKPGSSVAQIKEKEYFLHNLFAAMLVPSGNDAAYVVADYCGGLLSPQAESCQERVRIFMENLNLHLQQQGYLDTVKEYDILCLLAANKGRVLTYEQIYDKVWGEISAGNEKDTVGFHIRNLRKKLCDTNSHFSIDSVREIGYRFNSQ